MLKQVLLMVTNITVMHMWSLSENVYKSLQIVLFLHFDLHRPLIKAVKRAK